MSAGQGYDNDSCAVDTAEATSGIAFRAQVATAYANASPLSDIGRNVAIGKFGSLSGYDGRYQTLEVTVAYQIYDSSDGSEAGTYTVTYTTTHTGDLVVATSAEISKSDTETSDTLPSDPEYVDFSTILYDDSNVTVAVEVQETDLLAFIDSEFASKPFAILNEFGAPELQGWAHGVYLSPSFAVGRNCEYLIYITFDSENVDTDVANGGVSLPAASRVIAYDPNTGVATPGGTDRHTLPWNNDYFAFSEGDPAASDTGPATGWESFGRPGVNTWYSAEVFSSYADLWPLFEEIE